MRRNFRFSVALFTLIAVLLSLGVVTAQDKKILYTGRQMGPDDIPTLDPSTASDVPSVQIITEIFPELYRLDEVDVVVEAGVADATVSDDGLTYTFKIKPGITWVRYNPETDAVEQVMNEDGTPRALSVADC